MQLRTILKALSMALIVVSPVKGHAQEVEPPAEENASSETEQGATELPEMTVTASPIDDTSYNVQDATTATKTDTPIMETPVSIQVVPQQVLRDQQVVRIEKAFQNVSGVYTVESGAFQDSFAIRGFRTRNYYVDGARIDPGFSVSAPRETANIEQIEVLKGPASILYGRIEPGGLVNIVRKQPLTSPYYALEQQFGSFDFYRTTVDATGPLIQDDTLLYRLNLAYESAGSFREFLSGDRVFLAPALRWSIGPHTQANFYLEYLHSNDPQDLGLVTLPGENRPALLPRERNLGGPGAVTKTDQVRIGFNWSHELNEHWTLRQRFDADFTEAATPFFFFPLGFDPLNSSLLTRGIQSFNISDQTYTGSLDLTGKFDTFGLHHTLLFGGDFLHADNSFLGSSPRFAVPSIDIFNPVHTALPPGLFDNPDSRFSSDTVEDWYGFYLQDQVELPYHLHLLAGFRYDNAGTGSTFTSIIPGAAAPSETSLREDAVTPRFGLLWRPLPELSLFGSYVENFGASSGRTVDASPLPPETAQQWEVGLKTELFDGRLTGSLAWFDLTKQNIATRHPDPVLAAQGFSVPVGEVRNQGLEIDISGELSPGLQTIASFAYIDSEITIDRGLDFDNLDANGNPTITDGNTGHRLFSVPRFGGSLFTTYEFRSGDLRGWKLGAGMVARSQREGNNENDYQLPGYATVNLLAGYTRKIGSSKVSLQLNVDNLLDKSFFESSCGFRLCPFYGAPRTFLGSVRVEF